MQSYCNQESNVLIFSYVKFILAVVWMASNVQKNSVFDTVGMIVYR